MLSATDLRALNPEWSQSMIEDYLNLLDNFVSIAELVDIEIDKKLEEIATEFTDGSIPYVDSALLVEDNANLFWDTALKTLKIGGLTASRLVATDADKKLASVPDLTDWLTGTTDETTVTDDGDGTATVGLVHPVLLREPVTDWYDPTAGLPVGPTVGDRYISEATANGWTEDYIYEWDGVEWVESEPSEGWMVWMLLEFMFYFFFSGGWVEADKRVCVDSDATPGYLGAVDSDGVLRTAAPISYTDGGDFITLGIQNSPLFYYVRLAAGTAVAGTAPIKFTSGTALTTPETGAIEFHNDRFYITNVSERRAIDRTCCVITSTTTVTDTTTETTVYTGVIGADSLKVGNILKFHADGVLTNATASDDITLRMYLGATEVLSFNPALGNVTDEHWHIDGNMTVRTIGAAGTIAYHLDSDIDGSSNEEIGTGTIDTTIVEDFTLTVEWDNAKVGNIFSIYQGYTEWKG